MSEYEALDGGLLTGKSVLATEGLKRRRRIGKKQAKKTGAGVFSWKTVATEGLDLDYVLPIF